MTDAEAARVAKQALGVSGAWGDYPDGRRVGWETGWGGADIAMRLGSVTATLTYADFARRLRHPVTQVQGDLFAEAPA